MTTEKLKIGLDVDGVLADVIHTWLDYNNKIRKAISKEEISEWDFWGRYQIDKYDFYKELSLCWQTWHKIPSTEENISTTTSALSHVGEVDIVTAREESTHTYVKSWLSSQKITYKNYVGVLEGLEKTKLDYDIFIDDSPINAKSMLNAGKTVILYTQPWNLNFNDPRVKRIYTLKDSISIIKSITKQSDKI